LLALLFASAPLSRTIAAAAGCLKVRRFAGRGPASVGDRRSDKAIDDAPPEKGARWRAGVLRYQVIGTRPAAKG
jgi:hypothetical protein